MKKLHVYLAVFLNIIILLTACGPATADCTREDVFCVGLVTDIGKINDKSFHQSAWEGLQQAQSELGANIQYIETVDSRDYAKNIATFGEAGYDVIVTVGFTLGEATTAASAIYPNVDFIGIDQFQDEPVDHVTGLVFPEDNAGFLVGALAAMMSESNEIGAVCGPDTIPPVWRFGEGYRAGAAYADSLLGTTTEVFVVYHENDDKAFTDPEWGAAVAKDIMNEGADVIFGCGGVTGNGAIIAAAQAGGYAIGVDTDQYWTVFEAAPRMLSSAMKLITPSVFELIKRSKEGTLPSGNYFGDASYAPFHDLENEVPADVKSTLEEIHTGLLDGSIKTNVPTVKP